METREKGVKLTLTWLFLTNVREIINSIFNMKIKDFCHLKSENPTFLSLNNGSVVVQASEIEGLGEFRVENFGLSE